ncbi:hypothetical protein SAMN05444162_4469 [Paenibacillaceae bacterium GAS479]|nr:hypothetical protein SAMN05444162_4469 [Paenibacillaceae bacterium GAS479]
MRSDLTYRLILMASSLMLIPLVEETWQSTLLYVIAAYSGISTVVYIMIKATRNSV